jgi:bifunctional UDP-N-acetylglucosamine pyrophosphorylase/glucosamine-1-phosphate N-acetyltransferase
MSDIAIIVLAAGQGTRMKSSLHKVLHPVAGKAMINHLLDTLAGFGPTQTVIVVGSKEHQLRKALEGRSIEMVRQKTQVGTAHAALQAKKSLGGFTGKVLVCFGDCPMVSENSINKMIEAIDKGAEVAVLGFRPEHPLAYGRIITDSNGTVRKMVEAADASESELATNLCNSGLLIARAETLWPLLEDVKNDNAQKEYYLPDVATGAIKQGDKVMVIETHPDEVAGVNSRKELAEAESRWQAKRRVEAMRDGATLIAPETVFFSHDTKIGRDVTIGPNVVFGPGVIVEDEVTIQAFSHLEGARVGLGCTVGPFARLRPGTVMEDGSKVGNFVELKNATLGKEAKVNHLTYLGDTMVGELANIGAGTITCNYDGYFKYETKIGKEAFIGSNSSLIAPVTIGDRAIIAAGSAVTSDVDEDDLYIQRAPSKTKAGWAKRFAKAMKKKLR